jgi:hypothetical protein
MVGQWCDQGCRVFRMETVPPAIVLIPSEFVPAGAP